jgi:hypothetical protein
VTGFIAISTQQKLLLLQHAEASYGSEFRHKNKLKAKLKQKIAQFREINWHSAIKPVTSNSFL